MATSSGGQPPILNRQFIFKDNDFPDNLANKRPCTSSFDDFIMINGLRQKHENKFLLISHATDNNNFAKTSPFLIQKGLDQITKNLKNIKKIRSGQILIETKYSSQADKLLNATTLSGILPIKVELHPHLNSSKGIVYAPDLSNLDEETIQRELEDQKVIEVKRIRRLAHEKDKPADIDNDGFVQTPLLIVTFNISVLPKKLKAAYLMLNVEPYIPNPMRCKQCQRFGHTKKRCNQKSICSRCAREHDENHTEGVLCANNPQCANCHGPHEAFRKSCRKFKEEYAISKIKTVDRLTYKEAKDKYALLNPVNHMIPVSEIVKISNTASSRSKSLSDQSTATMLTLDPSTTHERATFSRHHSSPTKQTTSGMQLRSQVQNQQSPPKQQRVRQPPKPVPEPLSEENRDTLKKQLHEAIQKTNQNQQNNNNQKNNQNHQAEQAQETPNVLPFDFALPTSGMDIDRKVSDYESSSSNQSSTSTKKKHNKPKPRK